MMSNSPHNTYSFFRTTGDLIKITNIIYHAGKKFHELQGYRPRDPVRKLLVFIIMRDT